MIQQSGDGEAWDGEGSGRLHITTLKQIRMVTHLERERQHLVGQAPFFNTKELAYQCKYLPELHDEVEEV